MVPVPRPRRMGSTKASMRYTGTKGKENAVALPESMYMMSYTAVCTSAEAGDDGYVRKALYGAQMDSMI